MLPHQVRCPGVMQTRSQTGKLLPAQHGCQVPARTRRLVPCAGMFDSMETAMARMDQDFQRMDLELRRMDEQFDRQFQKLDKEIAESSKAIERRAQELASRQRAEAQQQKQAAERQLSRPGEVFSREEAFSEKWSQGPAHGQSYYYSSVHVYGGAGGYPMHTTAVPHVAAPMLLWPLLLAAVVGAMWTALTARFLANYNLTVYAPDRKFRMVALWPFLLVFSPSFREQFSSVIRGEKAPQKPSINAQ